LKKIILIAAILISLYGTTLLAAQYRNGEPSKQIMKQVNSNVCEDAIAGFLVPHIDKAIDDWYSNHPQFTGGGVDPWFIKVLSVERIPDQSSRMWFYIKVEVMPYVLAHISTGRDRITFMLMPSGEVKVEKYEHLESYPLPDRFKRSQPTPSLE
jgi:hypothetical protein